jgi:ABC-type branched-subunit amino acid transport system ATPase component
LVVDDVHVAYGRSEVLFGVSLEVPDGDLMCLMGRNGVGTSTLLNAIAGLLPLRSGSITHRGESLATISAAKRARRGIGYVPQGHAVFPQLTAREHLLVVSERAGRPDPPGVQRRDRSVPHAGDAARRAVRRIRCASPTATPWWTAAASCRRATRPPPTSPSSPA